MDTTRFSFINTSPVSYSPSFSSGSSSSSSSCIVCVMTHARLSGVNIMSQNAASLSSPLGSIITMQVARVIILVYISLLYPHQLHNQSIPSSTPYREYPQCVNPLLPTLILVPTPHIPPQVRITGMLHHHSCLPNLNFSCQYVRTRATFTTHQVVLLRPSPQRRHVCFLWNTWLYTFPRL